MTALSADEVLGQARRRVTALRDPYEKEQARRVIAASALAVHGADAAAKDLKAVDELTRLGRTAVELGLHPDTIAQLLQKAGCSVSAAASALAHLCAALAEQGDLARASAALAQLAEVDGDAHDFQVALVVRACVATGDLPRAEAIAARGIQPKRVAYAWSRVIEALCAAGRPSDAERLLPRVKEKDWRAGATQAVASAHLRARAEHRAAPLLDALAARRLAVVLGNVGAVWIAEGRIDDALALVERRRAQLDDEVPCALAAFIGPLAARGAWDRAETLMAQLREDFDAGHAWLRALAAAGREDDAARLYESAPIYSDRQAIACGMADRGDLLAGLQTLARGPTVLQQQLDEAIDAHVARLDRRAAVDWLLRVARTADAFPGIAGRLIELADPTTDPALFTEVSTALQAPPFGRTWLAALHERGAWRALAADDAPRALDCLRNVLARDPERAPYLVLAWGQLAAAMIARGELRTPSAIDEQLSALTRREHAAQAWAEAARALGLRERGVITRLGLT